MSDPARLRRAALVCAAAALALRLSAALGPGLDPVRLGDAAEYHAYASSLVSAGRYEGPDGARATRAPGYPAFLAAVYSAAGDSTRAVAVAQSLLGAATAALIVLSAGALLPMPWPLAAGAAAAVYRGLAEPCSWPLSESAYSFALALAVWALVRGPRGEAARGAAFGGALAAAALVRPDPLPFAALSLAVGGPLLPLSRRARLAAAAALALPFAAWTARNAAVLGRAVPTTTASAFVAYCGLHIPVEERFASPPRPAFVPDPALGELARQDAYAAEFGRLWRATPWTTRLKAYAFNLASVLYPFLPEYDWTFVALVPFWLAGLLAARGDPRWGFVAGLTLASLATYSVFGGPVSRYRTGFSPLLVLLAAAGLARLEARFGRRALARGAAAWILLQLGIWAGSGAAREAVRTLGARLF